MKIALFAVLSIVLLGSNVHSQVYTKQPVLTGLLSPTGIALGPTGNVYFTEVPTPGIGGMAGGMNRVSVLSPMTGTPVVLSAGEPEPMNLAVNGMVVYWTCRSAGVVLRRSGGMNSVVANNLMRPTGISVHSSGTLYLTLVPTPGIGGAAGGSNDVVRLENGMATSLSAGEPEPSDVVVGQNGDIYWTCRTAGVILKRSSMTGMNSLVAGGLESPNGIAMDDAGNLYFTEIPTPGVNGMAGGRNKVWKLDIASRVFTLISFGEPEPFDVAVTPDGASVYWTCTTAGVILRADRIGAAPRISTLGTATTGTTLRYLLSDPDGGGQHYVCATSLGLGPTAVGSGFVALKADQLLAISILSANGPCFAGYQGLLDSHGMGTAHLALPSVPEIVGMTLYSAFAVLDPSVPGMVSGISGTRFDRIQ